MNPRYLRFIQAVVLASLPACSAGEDAKESAPPTAPTAPTEEQSAVSPTEPREDAKPVTAKAEPTPPDVADAGVDAALPFSSGPIVPPELRVGLA
jgi:hypothetical protein